MPPRKERKDKGTIREVTRLKTLAKAYRDGFVKGNPYWEQWDTMWRGLKDLDGRMKVLFDPSTKK